MTPRITQKLTYNIAERLGRAIVTGTYSGVHPLPVEGELARQYGVSRTLMREAIKMLTAKGLIGARPRHGVFVLDERSWDFLDPDILRWMQGRNASLPLLREFLQLCLAVEPKAAALAAASASEGQKANIAAALKRIAESENGEDDRLSSQIAFHEALLHASGNRFYVQITALTEAALQLCSRMPERFGAMPQAVRLKAICDAILDANVPAAEAAMADVIETMLEKIGDAEREISVQSASSTVSRESATAFPRFSLRLS